MMDEMLRKCSLSMHTFQSSVSYIFQQLKIGRISGSRSEISERHSRERSIRSCFASANPVLFHEHIS